MLAQKNNSFATHAARAALVQNNNVQNIQKRPQKSPMASAPGVPASVSKNEIDKIVVSVENATKRLSQVSTNTNSSKRKSKNHVGPWRLGRTLGRGSTGRVRLAKHSESGQLAAVKIVPKSKFQKEGKAGEKTASPYGIEREIIIMKLISHQNIMGLYDVWENKGELYLVLEYVEGGELFDYLIKKGKLPEREALFYFRQIVSGVSYCHQFNICHRDLKPENLLLDRNNNIKIADFGMAALEVHHKLLETSCGSPHYASPEIVTGKSYHGSPSDIWSCGIILFALLTGHLPFDDENIRNLLLKVRTGRFVMPNYLSPEAKDLIWKMLKVNPADRITVNEIFKHPLMKKYETFALLKSKKDDVEKVDAYYKDVHHLILKREEIDHDILKSLSILFHGVNDAVLIPKLLSTRSNPEKIFYYLLLNYKKQHQLKEKNELSHNNSKKKIGNGDGLLKKSKSLAKTTITNEDGSTILTTEKVDLLPLPATPKKKVVKDATGQLQISASNSYRRGVSFNNKHGQLSQLSRSSSRRSVASNINANVASGVAVKKHLSILPPFPDLDLDWLNLGPEGMPEGEFAAVFKEIFNHHPEKSPKKPSPRQGKKQSFMTSTPLPLKKEETVKDIKRIPEVEMLTRSHNKNNEMSEGDRMADSVTVNERENIEPLSSKASVAALPKIDFNSRRSVTAPTPAAKQQTLDPSYKVRSESAGTDQVLQRLGVSMRRDQKGFSRIYYSKSSTSINLAAMLKNEAPQPQLTLQASRQPSRIPLLPTIASASSRDLPLPEQRISSSKYASSVNVESDDDADVSSSSVMHDMTFDFEMPSTTEIATAVPISNGSNITVGKKVKLREDSMFADAKNSHENLIRLSNSNESIVKHHKKASSGAEKVYSAMLDMRGSLYNNPSDLKDNECVPKVEGYDKHRFSHAIEFNDTKSIIMDNSIFADNTEDVIEIGAVKRVTMIFDEFNDNDSVASPVMGDTPVKSTITPFAATQRPISLSPLKNIQDNHFKHSLSGTLLKKDIHPQRVAPVAPIVRGTDTELGEAEPVKKSNWFTKFFASLMSNESANNRKKNDVRVFSTMVPMARMRRAIRLVLELKRKEGTLSMLKESGDTVSATIARTFTLGNPLRFEIQFNPASNEISLQKLRGSKRVFRDLIIAMELVIASEMQRYDEDQSVL